MCGFSYLRDDLSKEKVSIQIEISNFARYEADLHYLQLLSCRIRNRIIADKFWDASYFVKISLFNRNLLKTEKKDVCNIDFAITKPLLHLSTLLLPHNVDRDWVEIIDKKCISFVTKIFIISYRICSPCTLFASFYDSISVDEGSVHQFLQSRVMYILLVSLSPIIFSA